MKGFSHLGNHFTSADLQYRPRQSQTMSMIAEPGNCSGAQQPINVQNLAREIIAATAPDMTNPQIRRLEDEKRGLLATNAKLKKQIQNAKNASAGPQKQKSAPFTSRKQLLIQKTEWEHNKRILNDQVATLKMEVEAEEGVAKRLKTLERKHATIVDVLGNGLEDVVGELFEVGDGEEADLEVYVKGGDGCVF
ncbi:hypothetical protein HK097_000835 [Rhizophlyctis rosea]|uniref:Uncharacterized protein n=1 Tax=Rhizophlyctis rosea TaxID=64517 RepID=A0AAD5S548_9FUNG|nr:hypothetical protein HK097_000835 [Rhizophlyctis rosea]